jgi:hypothetical protein
MKRGKGEKMGGPEIIIPHIVTEIELNEMLDGKMTFQNALHKFFPNIKSYDRLEYEIIHPQYYGNYFKKDESASFGLKMMEPAYHHNDVAVGGLGLSPEGIGLLVKNGWEYLDEDRIVFQLTYLKPFIEHTRVFDLMRDTEENWKGSMTAHPMATVKMSSDFYVTEAKHKLESYLNNLNKLIVDEYLFRGK